MRPSPEHWLDKTHAGDCLGLLQRMRDDGVRVQTCITSPPYFRLRSYLPANHPDKPLEIGACATPEQYIDRLVQVFRVVREILTDDGTLWIVIGDSYAGSRSARSGSVYIGGKHGKAHLAQIQRHARKHDRPLHPFARIPVFAVQIPALLL